MVENLNYLVSPLLLAAFGLPAAFAPGLRRETRSLRFVAAFMVGVVAFVVWSSVLAVVGVKWSVFTVALPLGLASLIGAGLLARSSATDEAKDSGSRWDLLGYLIAAGAATHLALLAIGSRATSIDLFYFWGEKGLEFARADGFDAAYLSWPFSVHAHVPYPPLVSVVGAWGVDLVGRMPWRAALVSSVIWIAMAFPVVLRGLKSRLPSAEAATASGVWILGITLGVASSFSAGNAEPPLLFFTTVAIVVLIAREETFPRWVVPVAACGVILTKTEGLVLWMLLIAGSAARDLLERRRLGEIAKRLSGIVILPPLALATWYAFLIRHGIPISDRARESAGVISFGNLVPAVIESVRNMEAGSGWMAWGLAAIVIAMSRRGWRNVVPALTVTFGILGFLLVYYLHYQGDALASWVRWTLPRVSLTALSAALLAAAVASAGDETPGEKHEGSP